MFLKVSVLSILIFIQVTWAQYLPQDLASQHGFQNEPLSPTKRCARQTNLPDGMAINEYSFNNGVSNGNLPCIENSSPNNFAANNFIPNNNNFPKNIAAQSRNNVPVSRMLPHNHNGLLLNNMPVGSGLPNINNMPISNGMFNTNNLPFSNGISFGNSIPIGNNMPIGNGMPFSNGLQIGNNMPLSNLVPNYNNGPLINGIQNPNNIPINNGFLNGNNLPVNNILPNFSGMPGGNGFHNNLVPSNPGLFNLPVPYNLPINNMINGNNLPVNHFMPNSNILPNGVSNFPRSMLPIANGLNNFNFPVGNAMSNMNFLPNANMLPSINNFPVPNRMADLSINNMLFSGLELNNNNPFTIASNMPLHTIMPSFNNLPGNAMSSSVSFINPGTNTNRFINEGLIGGMPNNNLPEFQNILQSGLSIPTNLPLQSQIGLPNNFNSPNSLQIEGFGNLPLLNGLPIAGITETVSILNSPCD